MSSSQFEVTLPDSTPWPSFQAKDAHVETPYIQVGPGLWSKTKVDEWPARGFVVQHMTGPNEALYEFKADPSVNTWVFVFEFNEFTDLSKFGLGTTVVNTHSTSNGGHALIALLGPVAWAAFDHINSSTTSGRCFIDGIEVAMHVDQLYLSNLLPTRTYTINSTPEVKPDAIAKLKAASLPI